MLQRLWQSIKPPAWTVELEINANGIRLLQLKRSRGNVSLERCVTMPFASEEAIVNDMIKQPDVVIETIRQALMALSVRVKKVIAVIPVELIFSKQITVPADLKGEELEAHLAYVISDNMGLSLQQFYMDFREITAPLENGNDKTLLIVAADREQVDARLQLIIAAGLDPVRATVKCDDYTFNLFPWRVQHRQQNKIFFWGIGVFLLLIALGIGGWNKPKIITKKQQTARDDGIDTPLVHYPLASLNMVGTVKIDNVFYALIALPDASIQIVNKGDVVGQQHARIESINEKTIRLIAQDKTILFLQLKILNK